MKIILSLVLLAGVITTGCRSPARKLEPTAMGQIQEGKTTRAEVEKIFGPPYKVVKSSDQKTLTFHKRQQNRPNPDWRGPVTANAGAIVLRGLTIIYDTNQTVGKFLFSQSVTPVRRDEEGILIGWSPARADFTKIIKGITSRGRTHSLVRRADDANLDH